MTAALALLRAETPPAVRLPIVDMEIRPIPGRIGYWISATGRVFSDRCKAGVPGVLYARRTVIDPKRRHERRTPLSTAGYRKVKIEEREYLVHRLVVEAWQGPIAEGLVVRHLDGNPRHCCLSNLAPGTFEENEADKLLHGTRVMGVKMHNARLTEDDVREIRSALKRGESIHSLARRFDIDRKNITGIRDGKLWRHVA